MVPTRIAARAIILLALVVPVAAAAQERQISFDSAGGIEVLNLELARRFGLFATENPGFVEARLYQTDAGTTLEILARQDGQLVRTRTALSERELEDLRGRVDQSLAVSATAVPTENARYLLLAASTAMGLGMYGWALPAALDAEGEAYLGLYMLTASASFFVPWALTGHDVTPAMAQLGYYGGSRGFLHGAMLKHLLSGDEVSRECPDCNIDDDFFDEGALAGAVLVGAAEAVGGYQWAKRSRMTGGEANTLSLGGDWGLLNGLGASHVAGLNEDDDERTGSAIALLGSVGGMALGYAFARERDLSYGDAEVLATAGWLGALVGVSALDFASDKSEPLVAAAMAGSTLGILAADQLLSDADFSYGQSTVVRLGTIAGGLLGLGTGVLIEPDDAGDESIIAATSSIGALAGFAVAYRAMHPAAQRNAAVGSLRVRLAPEGILGLAKPALVERGPQLPLVSFEYRF